MLRLRRPPLALVPVGRRQKRLEVDLAERQVSIDDDMAELPVGAPKHIETHWNRFKANDTGKASRNQPAIKIVLQTAQHGKCAYCESPEATAIEHHWPKAPAPENAGRGTHTRMFQWDNLLYACSPCNQPSQKGSKMVWMPDGRCKLLNPYEPGDDPLNYFNIITHTSAGPIGWIEPRADLTSDSRERATYSITLLGLNRRDQLGRGRTHSIHNFEVLCKSLDAYGPDHMLSTGITVRQLLCSYLSGTTPYLAPIRQLLHTIPNLRNNLVMVMPELARILETWDIHVP